MTKHITKKRWLTRAALACGYVESAKNERYNVTLWLEHGCLHVRAHDHIKDGHIFWKNPENLTDARKLFSQTARELKIDRFIPWERD